MADDDSDTSTEPDLPPWESVPYEEIVNVQRHVRGYLVRSRRAWAFTHFCPVRWALWVQFHLGVWHLEHYKVSDEKFAVIEMTIAYQDTFENLPFWRLGY